MDSSGSRCWLHTQILMLRVLPILGFQTVRDPSFSCTLNRAVGESVQLPLNFSLSPDVREIEWNWNSVDEQKQFLVSWKPTTPSPEWYEFEDKYKRRFRLTEKYTLSILNLTVDMSGFYVAEIKFITGKSQKKDFRLCVYELIPKPQILIHSVSSTSGWCNVSLECGTPGTTENLMVTWLSSGFPRDLEQRETLSAASNSRNLSLSLPPSQLNGHLTCVVSNPVDQKNATLDLGSICPQRRPSQSKWLWGVLMVLVLGAGVYVWKRKKMETERDGPALLPAVPASATVSQAPPRADSADVQIGEFDSHDPPYAEISPLKPLKNNLDKDTCPAQTPKPTPEVHTVYEKIHKSPDPKGDT